MEQVKLSPNIAEVELIYKSKVKASERLIVNSSKDSYKIFLENWDMNKLEFVEQFKILLLNRAHSVLGIYELSTGGVTGTIADPKLIFIAALKANACCIILSHNHPSGNIYPSVADKEITKKIKSAGDLLDITVLDHIIVTSESYYSFAEEGIL